MTADQLAIVENGQCALTASGDQMRQTIFERILVGPNPSYCIRPHRFGGCFAR
jgi:hypothetical protein